MESYKNGHNNILFVGKEYTSIANVYEDIYLLMKSTKSTFIRKHSKTLNKVCLNTEFNNNLKFHEIYYKCNRSDDPENDKIKRINNQLADKNKRRNITRLEKTGCPASITFRAKKENQVLSVTSMCLDHNHELNDNHKELSGLKKKELIIPDKSTIQVYSNAIHDEPADFKNTNENNSLVKIVDSDLPLSDVISNELFVHKNNSLAENDQAIQLLHDINIEYDTLLQLFDISVEKKNEIDDVLNRIRLNLYQSSQADYISKMSVFNMMLDDFPAYETNDSFSTIFRVNKATSGDKYEEKDGEHDKLNNIIIENLCMNTNTSKITNKQTIHINDVEVAKNSIISDTNISNGLDLISYVISMHETQDVNNNENAELSNVENLNQILLNNSCDQYANNQININLKNDNSSTTTSDVIIPLHENESLMNKTHNISLDEIIAIQKLSIECDSGASNVDKNKTISDNISTLILSPSNTIHDLNVIPVKTKKHPHDLSSKPIGLPHAHKLPLVKFSRNKLGCKMRKFLQWIQLKEHIVESILNREYVVSITDINHLTDNVPDAIASDGVSDYLIKKLEPFFDPDAFQYLKKIIQTKRSLGPWTCSICSSPIREQSLECDGCLTWYHLSCVKIKKAPKEWFCFNCHKKI